MENVAILVRYPNSPFSIHRTTFPLHKMQEKGGFSMVIHVVQPGDSLYRIAQLHGVPLPFLIQQNEAARAVPAYARADHRCSAAGKDVHCPPRRHARQHLPRRTGTTVMQLWQNNPQLGGTDRIQPGRCLYSAMETSWDALR